ncbi:hypothetical protein [Stenoxybacter acetivorans]|uniref:hypothetical protein n=1 Tax=Stenoxybacter acetivorans TaxID=422441 RepID=UPI00056D962F|nr:hypothetical protein [Stenoxybacter acetivorans]
MKLNYKSLIFYIGYAILFIIFTLFLLFSFVYYQYTWNDNNPFEEIKLIDDGVIYELPFPPKKICILPPYGRRFSDVKLNDDEYYLSKKLNQFLDFKGFDQNQENQITMLSYNDENIFGVTVHRRGFNDFEIYR